MSVRDSHDDDAQSFSNGHHVVYGARGNELSCLDDNRDQVYGPQENRVARTVLIIDCHVLFAASLRIALAGKGLVAEQLATIGGIPQILAQAGAVSPDLVLLDLRFGHTDDGRRIDGVQLIGPLRAQGAAIVVITDGDSLPRIAAAVVAGAAGVVSKHGTLETLLDAIAAVTAGEAVMSVSVRQELLALHRDHQHREQRITQRLERLSPREREVLNLLARGHRIAAIAERFVVSPNTVRSQIRGILVKLDVNSQLEAAALVRGQPAVQEALSGDKSGERPLGCCHCGRTSTRHWPWCPHHAHTAGTPSAHRRSSSRTPYRSPAPPPGAPATRPSPAVATAAQRPALRSPETAPSPRRPAVPAGRATPRW